MKKAENYNYMLKYLFRILKKIQFYITRKKNLIILNKVKASGKNEEPEK